MNAHQPLPPERDNPAGCGFLLSVPFFIVAIIGFIKEKTGRGDDGNPVLVGLFAGSLIVLISLMVYAAYNDVDRENDGDSGWEEPDGPPLIVKHYMARGEWPPHKH